jgi:hypothetical protein
MAVQMAQGQMASWSATESAMPADCPMLAGADAAGDEQDAVHAACPSCQLCMGMTAAAAPAPALGNVAPASLVVQPSAAFHSADLVRQQKPPIS